MKAKETNKVLKTYFYYVLQKKWMYIVVVASVISIAFLDGLYPFLFGKIVDKLNISVFEDGAQLIKILFVTLVFRTIIEEILFYVEGLIDIKFLERKPRVDYVKKIQSLDYKFHSSKSTGSLISISSRINGALNTIFNNLNIWGLINVFDVSVSSYFLYTISPLLSILFMSTLLISIVVGYPLLKWNIKIRKKVIDEADKIGGVISDNLIGFETVKAFGQEEYEIERLEQRFDEWEKQGMKYILTFRFFDIAIYLITLLSAALIISITYSKVQSGIWTTGVLVTTVGYSYNMIWKAINLAYKAKDFMKASVDLKKFMDIMQTESVVQEKLDARDIGDIKKGISFKDVSFTYTETVDDENKSKKHVLEDVNFEIKLDQTVAFVGKSGSGKTTLAKLVMRYYDVDNGSIKVNGTDVKDLTLRSLRKAIGLVPQDPVMFNETIRYNISYGNPDASMEEIKEAARNSALDRFIESLPKGYDTVVGERGIKLSGGQRQRLAIARVMLENPEIIIFDEATSQLDSENEKAIQGAFANLTKHKTTIVIAHRLSTVMHADKIIVFDEGKIVEVGKHQDLMNNEGIYALLWRLQTEN
ncbi:MAG: ABC transporter ATP-binding protein [Candidatus Dojkabacteria bacterium]|jgi:ATP-binding cassette subfamily B protein|nr:ABC transporter ATP-binding protein/permease [Candidatus Dojkabacteria bacterium]MDD2270041.1 ABC transporter ATP-binding protein [Candidatus Dojkabacteria bacterium]